jgi:two-component system chemotaxis response regulator CheV
MSQTNILLEAGTNELEIVEFFLEEPDKAEPDKDAGDKAGKDATYRGYYGVNVAKVLEISRMPKVTELPEVQHPSVMGAFNLRSHIVPLVDLSLWLGKGHAAAQEEPKVIVTEFNGVTTAFMVSGVNRIHRISWENVEPPNRYVSMVSQNSITGVVKLEGRIVFLLDLENIVANLNPALGLHLDQAVNWGNEMSYHALIADDSGLIREMLKDLMQKANFVVEAVCNGHEAWERLLALKATAEKEGKPLTDYVQALVTDIEMPSMDGHNLCKRVKEDSMMKHLPVVLFSSLITDKLRHKGVEVGADDQISKPEVTDLDKRVYALIGERKQAGLM